MLFDAQAPYVLIHAFGNWVAELHCRSKAVPCLICFGIFSKQKTDVLRWPRYLQETWIRRPLMWRNWGCRKRRLDKFDKAWWRKKGKWISRNRKNMSNVSMNSAILSDMKRQNKLFLSCLTAILPALSNEFSKKAEHLESVSSPARLTKAASHAGQRPHRVNLPSSLSHVLRLHQDSTDSCAARDIWRSLHVSGVRCWNLYYLISLISEDKNAQNCELNTKTQKKFAGMAQVSYFCSETYDYFNVRFLVIHI